MDQNDLVAIQQSSKKICNPFGFDFTCKWAGKPITLSGDGQWYSVIAPLADHIARRLYMKIRYQFHDEQVAALKAKGDHAGARSYNVPADIENKIWMLITGDVYHKNVGVADDVQDEADLTVLKNEMKALEKKGMGDGRGVNISKILDKLNTDALPLADSVDGREDSAHVGGGVELNENAAPAAPVDTTPVNVADIQPNPGVIPADPTPAQTENPANPSVDAQPQGGEFAEINELDNEQPKQ